MSQIFRTREQEQEEEKSTFQIPNTRSALDALTEALQKEHQEQMEDPKNAKKKKKKRGGTICCCEVPGCGIGPFIEKNGEDNDG